MTKAVCPLCGSYDNDLRFSERNHDVLACRDCELFFIYPYEHNVHRKVATYNYDDLSIQDPARHYASSKHVYKPYISAIENECIAAKSILDVGCGTGYLLESLGRINPNARRVGIELNIKRAEFAKRVAGCEIYQVPIEAFEDQGKFDVITMINVLSHIPSIDALFTEIRKILVSDGKIILKVGEMALDVKQDAVFDWGIPGHLHFLGLKTIQFICSKYGFKSIAHDRRPLSVDLFSRGRWIASGRSSIRNVVKRAVAMTPFALSILRQLYDMRHGMTIYSSFIVLSPVIK